MQLTAELQIPKLAAISGTLRRLPQRSPSRPVGAPEWWQVIAATQTGSWARVSRALAALMGGGKRVGNIEKSTGVWIVKSNLINGMPLR
jgi:hypothetical protein